MIIGMQQALKVEFIQIDYKSLKDPLTGNYISTKYHALNKKAVSADFNTDLG